VEALVRKLQDPKGVPADTKDTAGADNALQVLRIVHHRLKAERRKDISPEVRLLANLLKEPDTQVRRTKLPAEWLINVISSLSLLNAGSI
jgi:hypothetical protein